MVEQQKKHEIEEGASVPVIKTETIETPQQEDKGAKKQSNLELSHNNININLPGKDQSANGANAKQDFTRQQQPMMYPMYPMMMNPSQMGMSMDPKNPTMFYIVPVPMDPTRMKEMQNMQNMGVNPQMQMPFSNYYYPFMMSPNFQQGDQHKMNYP